MRTWNDFWQSLQADNASMMEVFTKGGVKIVDRADLPLKANFVENLFVLCIKKHGTTNEKFKARWILQ